MDAPSTCLIAGGGPAGMVAGFLLARAGVPVTVLEKHKDFLRDFRGDTIHPSTLTVMDELGLLDEFLEEPHQKVFHAEAEIGDRRFRLADFTHVPAARPFLAFMPQWDFLDFLARKAKSLQAFRLLMETDVVDLLREGERTTGLRVRGGGGEREMKADLVIAADGRNSVLRDRAGLAVEDLGAPMDVLWFRLPHERHDENIVLGRVRDGHMLVMLDRGDYWQCALIIRKGGLGALKAAGLDAFRESVSALAHRSADGLSSWDDVKLLTVKVDRLPCWHLPGLLFIGDAAHAMSPIGGVGINLAVQDAVAAANILAAPLLDGRVQDADLARVQHRRQFPTWATQQAQMLIQDKLVDPILRSGRTPSVPWPVRLLDSAPLLQRLPARLIGLGARPEHVRVQAAC